MAIDGETVAHQSPHDLRGQEAVHEGPAAEHDPLQAALPRIRPQTAVIISTIVQWKRRAIRGRSGWCSRS